MNLSQNLVQALSALFRGLRDQRQVPDSPFSFCGQDCFTEGEAELKQA